MSIKTANAGSREGKRRRGEETASSSADNLAFPSTYNVTQVTLVARDPYWIFAYWEISVDSLEEARRHLGGGVDESAIILRMFDVSSGANQSFDIEVGRQATSWYVNLWRDNASYCAEIGLRKPDGHFHVLARSNSVTTPRASFSGREDVMWMERRESDVSQPFTLQDPLATGQRRESLRKDVVPPEPKPGRWSRRYLTEKDIRAYYAKLFPLLKRSRRKKKGLAGTVKTSQVSDTSLARDLFGYDRKYNPPRGELLGRFLQKEFLTRFLAGSSAEFLSPGGASENVLGRTSEGASEQIAPKPRKFFFELGTELIVYGRTEPDAQVFWGDKNIKLRDDGTFSLRMALPDATTIPLAFTAESADKVEKRSIVTSGIRTQTQYNP